jgi:predicted ATPase
MDMFYKACLDEPILAQKARRIHFHEFMLDVHARIHKFKQIEPRGNAMPVVAKNLASEAKVLCFDEFQVISITNETRSKCVR